MLGRSTRGARPQTQPVHYICAPVLSLFFQTNPSRTAHSSARVCTLTLDTKVPTQVAVCRQSPSEPYKKVKITSMHGPAERHTCTGSGIRMDAPRSATPERNVLMSHVSCLPVSRISLPATAVDTHV